MSSYEKRRADLETANLPLLHGFHQFLIDRRTGKRASCDHVDRIGFFASVFLLDYQDKSLAEGYDEIDAYLGDWFIRKTMFSDFGTFEANIASFRKFYEYLLSAGHLDQAGYQELLTLIETSAPVWLRHLERYNNPDIDLEDVWDYGDDDSDSQLGPSGQSPALPAEVPAPAGDFIMMLSGLAAKHFGITTRELPKTDDFAGEGHWSAFWRCDLIGSNDAEGIYYFLLTNARTLYSLVVPDRSRRLESLMADFTRILDHQFALAGLATAFQAGGTFRLVRGQPRSLIGSQNELIRCAIDLFERPGPSLDALCKDLNRVPMLKLPEIFPEDAFKELIVSDPPAAALSSGKVLAFPKPLRN